jgi:hypothetical protein
MMGIKAVPTSGDTAAEASCSSHAGGSGDGAAGGLTGMAAGVLGHGGDVGCVDWR